MIDVNHLLVGVCEKQLRYHPMMMIVGLLVL